MKHIKLSLFLLFSLVFSSFMHAKDLRETDDDLVFFRNEVTNAGEEIDDSVAFFVDLEAFDDEDEDDPEESLWNDYKELAYGDRDKQLSPREAMYVAQIMITDMSKLTALYMRIKLMQYQTQVAERSSKVWNHYKEKVVGSTDKELTPAEKIRIIAAMTQAVMVNIKDKMVSMKNAVIPGTQAPQDEAAITND